MSFSQSCYIIVPDKIKRNIMIEWLKELGYNYHACNNESDVGIHVSGSLIYSFRIGEDFPFLGAVNCGENIELFKALAAMNNENDYMQWFVMTETKTCRNILGFPTFKKGEFIRDPLRYFSTGGYRKATKEEIIQKFKK